MNITRETRRAGYEAVRPNLGARCLEILNCLGDRELTAREIAQELGYNDLNAVKPRLTELRGKGKVQAIGKRKDPITGVSVAVYRRV